LLSYSRVGKVFTKTFLALKEHFRGYQEKNKSAAIPSANNLPALVKTIF
jgi:hypothetical protein